MPLELIDNLKTAAAALGAMQAVRELAVDTEGASFHRFVDRVYLLQLSTRQTSVIIDPLAVSGETLSPLGVLVESPDVETVFHDADYDLRLLRRDYGWKIRKIFDTRIAAQLLGIKAFGLAALLDQYFGVKLDKKHQRADWSMRPLSRDMLDYAEQDTSYLLELKDLIKAELEKKGRAAWVREECDRLEETKWSEDDAGAAFMRIKGARDLSRRELAVLRELFAWRDSVARDVDRATFRVIGNEQLLELSHTQPSTPQSLGQTKGVSRSLLDRKGGDMIDAIRRGLEVAEDDLPKFPKAARWDRDPNFDPRVSKVKAARDEMAVQLDLDPGVLCARERMEAVARKNPQSREQLAEVTELRRWQVDVLGPSFLAALQGSP